MKIYIHKFNTIKCVLYNAKIYEIKCQLKFTFHHTNKNYLKELHQIMKFLIKNQITSCVFCALYYLNILRMIYLTNE